MCLGGSPSIPEPTPPAAPAATVVKSDVTGSNADNSAELDRLRKRRGFASTILSSNSAATNQAGNGMRTTLG